MLIRDAHPEDLPALLRIGDAVPGALRERRQRLEALLDLSRRSFSGDVSDPLDRQYLFVLESPGGQLVGTSMLIARHGTPSDPAVYFSLREQVHHSEQLGLTMRHQVLRLKVNEDGDTEIGGLVVLPPRFGEADTLVQLSFVRLLYVAMHPGRFRDEIIAELHPPLRPDGRSRFWEHLGRRFTGLPYQDADRLSRHDKRFVVSMFPEGDIYASFLPLAVQREIGQVGHAGRPMQRLLEAIGFRFGCSVDPFDAAPHFLAPTSEIGLVAARREGPLSGAGPDEDARDCLAATEPDEGPHRLRAVRTRASVHADAIRIPESARRRLGVSPGHTVHVSPLG